MNRLTRPNGSYILATFPKINLLVRMLPNAEVGTKKEKTYSCAYHRIPRVFVTCKVSWLRLVSSALRSWRMADSTSRELPNHYKPSFLLHSTDLEVLWTTGLHHHSLSLNPQKHPCMLTFSQFQRQADILSSTSRHFPETQTGHETEWMHSNSYTSGLWSTSKFLQRNLNIRQSVRQMRICKYISLTSQSMATAKSRKHRRTSNRFSWHLRPGRIWLFKHVSCNFALASNTILVLVVDLSEQHTGK